MGYSNYIIKVTEDRRGLNPKDLVNSHLSSVIRKTRLSNLYAGSGGLPLLDYRLWTND